MVKNKPRQNKRGFLKIIINLQIKKISAVNGVYTVELSGAVSLGGSCDDPRFYSQIMETIQQFPTVKKAEVFINGKKLEDVVSEKG